MKTRLLILAIFATLLCISFNAQAREQTIIRTSTIVTCYTNDSGHKIFVLDNGGTAQVVMNDPRYANHAVYRTADGSTTVRGHGEYDDELYLWNNAEIGDTVRIYIKYESSLFSTSTRILYYVPIPAKDYTQELVVTKVTKYDGQMSRIEGSRNLWRGYVKGEGMGSENFYINIYFADHEPLCVNAKDNQLWLDIEVGSIVIKRRAGGKLMYYPKY